MLARLLPRNADTSLADELTRMGHPAPGNIPAPPAGHFGCKLIDVPRDTAAALSTWLRQVPSGWCVDAPHNDAVDVLWGGAKDLPSLLCKAAGNQPALRPVAAALEQARCLQAGGPRALVLGQTTWPLLQRTRVMGILNITPDSFSDGGLYCEPERALARAEAMLAEGADLIDVGGQSSRPGSEPVPAAVEQARVAPVVREIVKRHNALVSVDTYRADVAAAALDAGAVMVNDISALHFDPGMAPLLAQRDAAVVLMHMQGTPRTMQQAPVYHHVIDDIYGFLCERLQDAVQAGITRQRIVLDPGFGFGKTVAHNLDLLRGLDHLGGLGQPLLVGTSRKSFLGHLLQRPVGDRLAGSLAAALWAAQRGAALVRVHDVGATVQALALLEGLDAPAAETYCQLEPHRGR